MKSKRLLCCIFALIMILNLSVFPVLAEEQSEKQTPAYLEEAAADLREGLKAHQEIIEISFLVDPDSFDGTYDSAWELGYQIQELGLAHTGVPNEGDFLRFSLWYFGLTDVDFAWQADGWQFTMEYYAVYYTTAEQEAELDTEIEALVEQLELKSDRTDYQKISAIYNYICSTVTYDYETLEDDAYGLKWSAYAAAVNKTAVCQGYATLFYRLALEAGIDNRIITGEAINADGETESHAWNTVKLDGKYFLLDSTWDSEMYDFQWFLKSSADFVDHDPYPEYVTDDFLAAYPPAEESYEHPNVENAVDGDYEYQVIGGKAVLLQYNGTEQDVVVPATLGGYPVY